jgi:hypothetical protein
MLRFCRKTERFESKEKIDNPFLSSVREATNGPNCQRSRPTTPPVIVIRSPLHYSYFMQPPSSQTTRIALHPSKQTALQLSGSSHLLSSLATKTSAIQFIPIPTRTQINISPLFKTTPYPRNAHHYIASQTDLRAFHIG